MDRGTNVTEPSLLQLFGSPSLEYRSGVSVPLRSAKSIALLSYLVLENHTHHSRQSLASLLWSENDDSTARRNLSQAFKRLRDALGDNNAKQSSRFFVISRDSIGMRPDADFECDASSFESLIETVGSHKHQSIERCDECQILLKQAVALATKRLLDGLHPGRGAEQYEDWLLLKREAIFQSLLSALAALTTAAQQSAEFADAIGYARRQISLEPWRESAHRQLIDALASNRQLKAALTQFEACKRILAAELGIEPSSATLALVERIQRGEVAEPVMESQVVGSNLPAALMPFFGREGEQAEIIERLLSAESRLISVVGQGGVGKTSLTLAIGRHLQTLGKLPFDEICFVPLAAVDSAELLPANIANAMSLKYDVTRPIAEAIIEQLHTRKPLLILDNLEHLLQGSDWLIDLLNRAPGVKLLISSRERLGMISEDCFELSGLPVPPDTAAPTCANDYDASRLFLDRARRQFKQFKLDAENWPAVVQICQRLEGLPLGIELATTLVSDFSVNELAQSLASDIDLLETDLRDIAPHHRSIRQVFEQSWNGLSEREQQTLARLSVMRGKFSMKAGMAVAQTSPLTLRRLRGKSLLRSAAAGRFDMHELVRQFSAEKLHNQPDAHQQTQDKHAIYFLKKLAEIAPAQLDDPTQRDKVRANQSNFYAAWMHAVASNQISLLNLAIDNFVYLHIAMFANRQGIHYLRLLKRQPGIFNSLNHKAEGPADYRQLYLATHLAEARLLSDSAVYAQSAPLLDHVVKLIRNDDSPRMVANAYRDRGRAALHQGDNIEALKWFEQAVPFAERGGDPVVEAAVLREIGSVYRQRGEYECHIDYTRRALEICQSVGDSAWTQMLLGWIGWAELELGRYWDGYLNLQKAQQFNDITGSPYQRASLDSAIGQAQARLGNYDDAVLRHHRAMPQLESIDATWRVIMLRIDLAIPLMHLGKIAEALANLSIAGEMAASHLLVEMMARTQLARAYVLMRDERWDESYSAFELAREQMQGLDRKIGVIEAQINMAYISLQQDQVARSRELVGEGLAYVAQQPLHGSYQCELLYRTAQQVALALASPFADEIKMRAEAFVASVAANIADEQVRETYLASLSNLIHVSQYALR